MCVRFCTCITVCACAPCHLSRVRNFEVKGRGQFPWRERASSWGGEKLSDRNPFKPMPLKTDLRLNDHQPSWKISGWWCNFTILKDISLISQWKDYPIYYIFWYIYIYTYISFTTSMPGMHAWGYAWWFQIYEMENIWDNKDKLVI